MAQYRAPLAILALAIAKLAAAQCNPTNASTAPCPPIQGFTEPCHVDFTSISSVPSDITVASYEDSFLHFGSNGLEFRLENGNSAPYIWTSKYMHYGTASAIMQTAPGIGVISSAVLLSDTLDEIDYEMSGNDFTYSVPTVQTNYFGKGIDGSWDRGTQPQVSANMTNHFFNFTQVWTPTSITWMINGTVLRTLLASDCDTRTHQYPQGPARYHIGVWDAGNPNSPWYTANWAGGYTQSSSFPSSMYLKSIYIQPYKSCAYYNYSDITGSGDSVQCLSGLPAGAVTSSAAQTKTSNAPIASGTTTATTASCAAMPTHTQPGIPAGCAQYYLVKSGDNCATIATDSGVSEDDLKTWNTGIGDDCSNLWANYHICVSAPGVCNGTATTTSAATSSSKTTTITSSVSHASSTSAPSASSSSTKSSSSSSTAGASTIASSATISAAPSSLQTVASEASASSTSGSGAAAAATGSASVPSATGALGGNPIYTPGSGDIVPAGKPYNITWTPTTSGSISLVLLKGPSSNMVIDSTIANDIANSGYYVWTPSTSLVPSDGANGYGIELIVYATGDYQYSTQFGISNDQYTLPAMLDLPVSTNGACGAAAATVCKGSAFGDCCSAYGYCGSTSDFCSVAAGCLWQYGTCGEDTSSDASSSSISIAATSPGSSTGTVSSSASAATVSSSSITTSSSPFTSSSTTASSTIPSSAASSSVSTSSPSQTSSTGSGSASPLASATSSSSTPKTSSSGSISSTMTYATAAPKCPGSNNTIYTSNGQDFLIECGIDHSAGDLTSKDVSSFQECIEACAQNSQCVDVSLSGVACYLKKSVGSPVFNEVYGARLLTSSSTSLSVVASTARIVSVASSAVVPSARATVSASAVRCPSANRTIYEVDGKQFLIEVVFSLAACIEACANTNLCVDVSLSGVACYMKYKVGTPVYNGVYGARLLTSSTTSSSATPTSASVSSVFGAGRLDGTTIASSAKSSSSSSSTSPTITTSTKALSASSTLSSTIATVSSAPTDPAGFSYAGCYTEVSGRALSQKSTAQNGMTNEKCATFCAGYAWFATEYSNECYCGNTLHASSKPATDGRCKMTCSGDRSKCCGGSDGLSLYKSLTTKAQGSPAVLNGTHGYASMGCYSDNSFSRVLHTVFLDSKMTIELCAAQAKALGHDYFGIEYGNECWMGPTMQNNPRSMDQSSCSTACPGDGTEYCGAGNALQMYSCGFDDSSDFSKSSNSHNSNWWWRRT